MDLISKFGLGTDSMILRVFSNLNDSMYEATAPDRGKAYVSRACKVPASVESQRPAVPSIYGGHASTLFSTSSTIAIIAFLFLEIAPSWRFSQ